MRYALASAKCIMATNFSFLRGKNDPVATDVGHVDPPELSGRYVGQVYPLLGKRTPGEIALKVEV